MSIRRLSPAASLLRNSRLFALPQPISRPSTASERGTLEFDSETATTPHPTHAAIETSEKSLARGDWGLKRPLPLKSTTKTSTPAIRIDNVDSIDFITDFGSAAEHTRTLAKWQEMELPLATIDLERKSTHTELKAPKSVFEANVDSTAKHEDGEHTRWRFEGPWLAGLNHGEFQYFLRKKVGKRKLEFQKFLRQRLRQKRETDRRREQAEAGLDVANKGRSAQSSAEISDEEFAVFVKQLHANQDIMRRLVGEFLDLPREKGMQVSTIQRASYNERGPPNTHPSGGLSYLRTASHMFNHPLLGPQDDKTPVEARVLLPQMEYGLGSRKAVLGVAGVVTEDINQPFSRRSDEPQVERFDPDHPGGGKVWVEPTRANLDREGSIQLTIKRAEDAAIAVWKTDRGKYRATESPAEPARSGAPSQDRSARSMAGGGDAKGYGLEDFRLPRREQTQPFDARQTSAVSSLMNSALENGRPNKR